MLANGKVKRNKKIFKERKGENRKLNRQNSEAKGICFTIITLIPLDR